MAHKERIMYVEKKKDGVSAEWARIGLVTFSKTGKTIYFDGRTLIQGSGFKSTHFDEETRDEYWISGCKKDGTDSLYSVRIEIDEDVREEYWTKIRNKPKKKDVESFHCPGKYSK